ncbi:MAG: hypothetical protein IV100_19860 [Myxococcales bacterium]|nr:hypothetical protein [Myxococcales bacterium]
MSALVILLAACTSVRGSAVSTAGFERYTGAVQVVAHSDPPGMKEVGMVEVHGGAQLDDLVKEFRKKTAEVGGRVGKIDSIQTRFDWKTQSSIQGYNCGTVSSPKTCYRTVNRQVEVAITSIVGRAFSSH